MPLIAFLKKRWYLLNSIWNFRYLWYRLFREQREFEKFYQLNPKVNPVKFSIITPTYKIKSHLLVSFFQSLENQSAHNFEVCLCNDGDKDPNVLQVIQDYSSRWGDRFKYVEHISNKGISEATNSAISIATGEYFLFIDADDELHPQAIEVLNHYIGTNPEVEVIYTDHDMMNDWGMRYRAIRKPFLSPELYLKMNYMNHLTVMKKSSFFFLDRPFRKDYDGSQDFSLTIKAIQARAVFGYIPLILYFWRMHPGSVAMNPLSKPWAYIAFRRVQKEIIYEMTKGQILVDETDSSFHIVKKRVNIILYGHLETQDFQRALVESNPSFKFQFINSVELAGLSAALDKIDDEANLLFLNSELLDHTDLKDFEQNLAYGLIDRVACVFPFMNKKRKSCYDFKGTHFFEMNRKFEFSEFSGNVVTGPTHGMVIVKRKLSQLMPDAQKVGIEDWSQLGPILGIHALNSNYRNACADGILCGQKLEPFENSSLKLPFNPYH